jgi:LmbE family N-acetylglucosaminyl deacetylase
MSVAIRGPVLIAAAHPDDETIGLGGQLAGLRDVFVVHITDGAPLHHPDRAVYADLRKAEMLAALEVAGLGPDRVYSLGEVDQQSSRSLARLARDLAALIGHTRAASVFTHPYEGGHPDHDAASCALHCAARLIQRSGGTPPELYEFTSYHNGDPHALRSWMRVGEFLPAHPPGQHTVPLSSEARLRKRSMFNCYASQRHMLEWFPIALERIRRAPAYDYLRPPHAGRLFYEDQDWGWNGTEWRRFALGAFIELDLLPDPLHPLEVHSIHKHGLA